MGIFDKFINRVLDMEIPGTKKPAEEEEPGPFSMKIDSVFSIAGRGTVVTGKIDSGAIKLNEEVIIIGGDQHKTVKITGIEQYNKLLEKAKVGDEVGLLLKNVNKDEVKKGAIVVKAGENYNSLDIHPQIGKVMYTERYIPDDSEEAKHIRARQEAWNKMTPAERSRTTAEETRERMESIGLTMYVWETCGDERVCPACRVMDGKLCRWDDPTVYSRNKGKDWIPRPKTAVMVHPGENICKKEGHCRCTSIAYEPELLCEL